MKTLADLRAQRLATMSRIAQLKRRLDNSLLKNLLRRAREIRPFVERDGEGLTELEFVLTMLLELGIVTVGAPGPGRSPHPPLESPTHAPNSPNSPLTPPTQIHPTPHRSCRAL